MVVVVRFWRVDHFSPRRLGQGWPSEEACENDRRTTRKCLYRLIIESPHNNRSMLEDENGLLSPMVIASFRGPPSEGFQMLVTKRV